ncbi:MAG: choice-of-anchor Q domain-containing protein, partial [Anaerolineales bacterium]
MFNIKSIVRKFFVLLFAASLLALFCNARVTPARASVAPIQLAQSDTETPTPTESPSPTETETPTEFPAPTGTATGTTTESPTVTATVALTEVPADTQTPTPTVTQTTTATATANISNRYVAPGGVDAGSCNNLATPCATINYALSQAASGNTVYVAQGTYTGSGAEVVRIDKAIALSGGWDAGFSAQSGLSTIDGETVRQGIYTTGSHVVVDHFQIQHGFDSTKGGGIRVEGASSELTLNNSIVSNNVSHWMGGGIYAGGSVIVNNSAITGNSGGNSNTSGGGGGGGISSSGVRPVVLNNSTVSGNTLLGSFYGSGINGSVTLNNSTVSGNTNGEGIYSFVNTIVLNNSTITNNQRTGITNEGGHVSLQNTIIAGNGGYDCYNNSSYAGTVTSLGYNLIGNRSFCSFTQTTGDLTGTNSNPINARLGPLQDNGGPTFTHALLPGSPTLNAGNPAAPGSGGNACLATDQRGIDRSGNSRCDIGAYEVDGPLVSSIQRANADPNSALQVNFTVTFFEVVTGVDTIAPFSDFSLTTTGVADASIAAVSGSGNTYTVTVNTGAGNKTIRLNVVDDDSIQSASGKLLGGPGLGNGNFTNGQIYTILTVPTPVSPVDSTTDTTPTYTWSKISGATNYQYQLLKGTKTIYTRNVAASACGPSNCSNTPTTTLSLGSYQWKVRALVDGVWKNYSLFKAFKIVDVKAGFWTAPGLEFYVT